jgi:hypothetical protein
MIPSFVLGDIVFSDTYARLAAELLGDVSDALVRVTSRWDVVLELKSHRPEDLDYVLVQRLSVDAAAMVAAANYCHWIRDHVLYEVAEFRNADACNGQRFAAVVGDVDHATLYQVEQQEVVRAAGETPLLDPPTFPPALQQIHRARRLAVSVAQKFDEIDEDLRVILDIDEDLRTARRRLFEQGSVEIDEHWYAERFEEIRETLAEATGAVMRSRTPKTDVLVQHLNALCTWVTGSESS